mgnify:CR=1 FL=1
MKHYRITEVATGNVVYDYNHDEMLWFDSWPEGEYAQEEIVDTPPPQEYSGSWHITKLAFRNRFSQAEKVAIEIAALDNPAATMPQRAQAAALRASQQDVAVATFIDLTRADTRAGVQALEAAGLLAAGRAAVILDTPPTEAELFQ